jgi:hypothetical protein
LKLSLLKLLDGIKAEGRRIAVYGASAKGSTLLNYFGLGRSSLDYVGDLSRLFPAARFVHLHRDGREAALSMREHHAFRLAICMTTQVLSRGRPHSLAELDRIGAEAAAGQDEIGRMLASHPTPNPSALERAGRARPGGGARASAGAWLACAEDCRRARADTAPDRGLLLDPDRDGWIRAAALARRAGRALRAARARPAGGPAAVAPGQRLLGRGVTRRAPPRSASRRRPTPRPAPRRRRRRRRLLAFSTQVAGDVFCRARSHPARLHRAGARRRGSQTAQALRNVETIPAAEARSPRDVAKCTVYPPTWRLCGDERGLRPPFFAGARPRAPPSPPPAGVRRRAELTASPSVPRGAGDD